MTIRHNAAALSCIRKVLLIAIAALFALSAAPAHARALSANPPASVPLPAATQDAASGFGRLDPSPPSGITPEQIIQKFGARETEFQKVRDEYIFTQSVKIDTISDDTGKPDGEYRQITNVTFDDNGKRLEKVIFAPANTLQRVTLTENDFDEIAFRQPFILTTAELPQYDVKYLGRQKVDDLDTYVFEAGPKYIQKKKHYFQGKVWVDQQDFQIVLVNGSTVPQDERPGHEDLSPPFTTYYEQIDGKYWFPTYTKAEGVLHFQAQQGALSEDDHIRSIVRYTDYKRFHAKSRIIYNGEELPANGADKPPPKP
jgi:hypothetical protein